MNSDLALPLATAVLCAFADRMRAPRLWHIASTRTRIAVCADCHYTSPPCPAAPALVLSGLGQGTGGGGVVILAPLLPVPVSCGPGSAIQRAPAVARLQSRFATNSWPYVLLYKIHRYGTPDPDPLGVPYVSLLPFDSPSYSASTAASAGSGCGAEPLPLSPSLTFHLFAVRTLGASPALTICDPVMPETSRSLSWTLTRNSGHDLGDFGFGLDRPLSALGLSWGCPRRA